MLIDDLETLENNIPDVIWLIFSVGVYIAGVMMVYVSTCALCGI